MKKLFTVVLIVFSVLLCSCKTIYRFPSEGAWFCEELQLQIAIGKSGEDFILTDGTPTVCQAVTLGSSEYITVTCQDFESEYWEAGDLILRGMSLEFDEKTWQIKDLDSDIIYTFRRVK